MLLFSVDYETTLSILSRNNGHFPNALEELQKHKGKYDDN